MNHSEFLKATESASNFELRRAAERLRDGLFDPLGVRLLTVGNEQLDRVFDQGADNAGKNKPAHLCICGSYGQGKSHSLTYLCQRASEQGFVTASVTLDPRERPLSNFQQVFREIMASIRFPDPAMSLMTLWQKQVHSKTGELMDDSFENRVFDLLPPEMPLLFKAIMAALVRENISVSEQQKQTKKHADIRVREIPYLLTRALSGESVPVARLKQAFICRQVSFWKKSPLTCRGWQPYLQMIHALNSLFRQMGFKGWAVFFDEGESVVQTRISSRSKSYQILDQIFFPEHSVPGFYPIIAFTDDFFLKVQQEDYDSIRMRKGDEIQRFGKNYAQAWHDMTVYQLQDLSSKDWKDLSEKLIVLHGAAYGWQPFETEIRNEMAERLLESRQLETRLKIKVLLDQLDLMQQGQVLEVRSEK